MEGEAITYNDYFNESSDQGSYVESSEDEDSVDSVFRPPQPPARRCYAICAACHAARV